MYNIKVPSPVSAFTGEGFPVPMEPLGMRTCMDNGYRWYFWILFSSSPFCSSQSLVSVGFVYNPPFTSNIPGIDTLHTQLQLFFQKVQYSEYIIYHTQHPLYRVELFATVFSGSYYVIFQT